MALILGTLAAEGYRFDEDEIRKFAANENLSGGQLQEIADILAANVELPRVNSEGYVELVSENFNDSFRDMEYELQYDYRAK